MVANRSVREVSIEMADTLLTPERQKADAADQPLLR